MGSEYRNTRSHRNTANTDSQQIERPLTRHSDRRCTSNNEVQPSAVSANQGGQHWQHRADQTPARKRPNQLDWPEQKKGMLTVIGSDPNEP